MTRLKKRTECSVSYMFRKFILDSKSGKRLQPNGKRYSPGTIKNYESTEKLLLEFSKSRSFPLRIYMVSQLNSREIDRERTYWTRFHRMFSSYLYDDLKFYDNHAGQQIKNVKVFFNYLNKQYGFGLVDIQKIFYVRKEEIRIYPLLPEELNYLIYDQAFSDRLKPRMKQVKDFFVFGCTVGLRVSDLFALKRSNVRINNGQHYLSVRSIKTNLDTLIKLPQYAVEILDRYEKSKKVLLPVFNKSNLNKYIKQLLELAGFTQNVTVSRQRRGKPVELKKMGNKSIRFCDVASTHTMRRTAITTMLSLGMTEQLVRKISGHAPGSKEFYRYVLWAQTYQDKESDMVFEKLKEKVLTA